MQSNAGSSYQVIARKWRPGAFKEVVGQSHVVRTLSNAVDSGRIGHAFIFSGPRGVGKTTVARILAKCLNCSQGPTSEPCLKCDNCTGITGGSLVDVLEIDGASNNSVENVRELCESVRYAPASARYKIYIIDEVHMLSTSAFNALLKTLEEPPGHVIFIFATTEPQKIPLTIHSRCQRFDFRRIPLKQITSHLSAIAAKEGIDATAEAIFMVSREADGSLRDAQSLLEQVISFSGNKLTEADIRDSLGLMDRNIIFELSEAVLGRDGGAVLNIVEKIHEFGYDFKKVTADLLEHLRDLVVVKVSGTAILELPESEIERITALAELAELGRLEMLFGLFTGGYNEVVRSTTPRFAFEMMLVRATLLEDLRPIGELVASLNKIGKIGKIGRGGTGRDGTGSGGGGQGKIKRNEAGATSKPSAVRQVPLDSSPVGSSESMPVRRAHLDSSAMASSGSSAKASVLDSSAMASSESMPVRRAPMPVRRAPSAKASSDSAKDLSGAKTTAGLMDFLKASDMLIYNRLKAASLDLVGERLKIIASSGDLNFLQNVKKDALVGLCRDYFKTNIRLGFEKGDGSSVASVSSSARAAPNLGAKAVEPQAEQDLPPLPDRTEMPDSIEMAEIIAEPLAYESFSVIDEAVNRPEAIEAKEEKEVKEAKEPEESREEALASASVEEASDSDIVKDRGEPPSANIDTVLKDTLAALGGKVIA